MKKSVLAAFATILIGVPAGLALWKGFWFSAGFSVAAAAGVMGLAMALSLTPLDIRLSCAFGRGREIVAHGGASWMLGLVRLAFDLEGEAWTMIARGFFLTFRKTGGQAIEPPVSVRAGIPGPPSPVESPAEAQAQPQTERPPEAQVPLQSERPPEGVVPLQSERAPEGVVPRHAAPPTDIPFQPPAEASMEPETARVPEPEIQASAEPSASVESPAAPVFPGPPEPSGPSAPPSQTHEPVMAGFPSEDQGPSPGKTEDESRSVRPDESVELGPEPPREPPCSGGPGRFLIAQLTRLREFIDKIEARRIELKTRYVEARSTFGPALALAAGKLLKLAIRLFGSVKPRSVLLTARGGMKSDPCLTGEAAAVIFVLSGIAPRWLELRFTPDFDDTAREGGAEIDVRISLARIASAIVFLLGDPRLYFQALRTYRRARSNSR